MKFLTLTFLLFITNSILSQTFTYTFYGVITNHDTKKEEKNVLISIIVKGKTIDSLYTSKDGSYKMTKPVILGDTIYIVFSKIGFVSKKIELITSIPSSEEILDISTESFNFSGSIFTERTGIDFSFLNTEPVAIMKWDDSTGVYIIDRVASNIVRAKIETLLNPTTESTPSSTTTK